MSNLLKSLEAAPALVPVLVQPVVGLPHLADRENVDLIVIGGGKSTLKERVLGSTTSRVASQIKRPILVAK